MPREPVPPVADLPPQRTADVEPTAPVETAEVPAPVVEQESVAPSIDKPEPPAADKRPEKPVARPQPAVTMPQPAPREPAPTPVRMAEAAEAAGIWQPLIDPAVVLAGILRSKWLILAMTILGALLGVLVAMNTPKKYEAAAELLADPRDLNLVDRELTQSGISNEATLAIVENQVRILTSGTVIAKVVDRLKLAEDPEFNGRGGGLSLRGMISSVRSMIFPSARSDDPARRNALAAINLARSLSIERRGKTFIIVVGATTQSAEKSALVANTMTEVFLQSYGQLQSDAAGRAASELTSKLDELRNSVELAERKVEAFKSENDLINAQGRLITDDEILKLNDQLSTARARTLELNAKAASARDINAAAVLDGSLPEELASPTMQELRAQYSTLKGEADRLATRLGPRHPQLLALQSQLGGARGLIEAEVGRIAASTQTELRRAVQLEQELSSRLAQLKVRQGDLSNEMVTLRELERDANAKRAVYESFLLRARETGEQQGINSANISVISKAYPPLEAEPPSRTTIAMAGTILGLMAGIGIGGLRGTAAALRERVRGRRSVQSWRRGRTATMFDQDEGTDAADDGARDPTVETRQPVTSARSDADDRADAAISAEMEDAAAQHARSAYPAAPHAAQDIAAGEPPEAAYSYPPPEPPVDHTSAYRQYTPRSPYREPYGSDRHDPADRRPAAGLPPPWQHAAGWPGSPTDSREAPPPASYPWQPAAPMEQPETRPAQEPSAGSQQSIDEIRSDLRELREAIRDLAEARSRRRYF